jgi:prepilin signal peptidase PulO-like enzyme (type II secretory pathway)
MITILYAVIGGLIGVLINYLSDVLPSNRKLARPRCPSCGALFSWHNYLISFKCSTCQSRIPIRNILVILLSIVACILVSIFPFLGLSFWLSLPILAFLGVILVIDVEYKVVLIQTSIVGLILMALYGLLVRGFLQTIIGGVAGFLIMLGFYFFGILFSNVMSRIRKQNIDEVALGFGDVYVCGFMGFLIGWPSIIGGIVLAILASGVFSLFYIIVLSLFKKYSSFSAIPYTPFIILASLAIPYLGTILTP